MSNNGHKEQTRNFYQESNKDDNEALWNKLKIHFYRKAPSFPTNKIYADIDIKPEKARKLIKIFRLVVDETNRCEFPGDYREISASGFDAIKENKTISVKIRAIPFNNNWGNEIESEACEFKFTGETLDYFNTTVSFKWENDLLEYVLIKWNHIGDRMAQKYIVCLDNKEIQYINQLLIEPELKLYIYNLKPGEKHTIEIIAKLSNGKITRRSDQIEFDVRKQMDEQNGTVINIINEPIPPNLLAVTDADEDKQAEKPPSPKRDEFKDRAEQLLRELKRQLKQRNAV